MLFDTHSRGPDDGRPTKIGMLRLRTLVRLRWLAIVGQTGAVLGVHFVSRLSAAAGPLSRAPSRSAPGSTSFSPSAGARAYACNATHAGLLLVYDVLPAGRAALPDGRAARIPFPSCSWCPSPFRPRRCSLRWTLWLGVIAFCCASVLAFEHLPLPWKPGEELVLPSIYIAGMWAAIVCGVVFSAIYARRIADEARQMSGRTDGHRAGAGPRAAPVGARRPGRRGRA